MMYVEFRSCQCLPFVLKRYVLVCSNKYSSYVVAPCVPVETRYGCQWESRSHRLGRLVDEIYGGITASLSCPSRSRQPLHQTEDYDDVSKGDKSESERVERACRMRIDEGCDDGEGAVGRPLGDVEVSSSILSAAEAGDGATGLSNHEKQEENCKDHIQSVFDNFKVWDKKQKKNT